MSFLLFLKFIQSCKHISFLNFITLGFASCGSFSNSIHWSSVPTIINSKDDAIKWQEVEKFDANGILLENVTETGSVAVLITGEVREKYLEHYDSSMKKALFKNKIILR